MLAGLLARNYVTDRQDVPGLWSEGLKMRYLRDRPLKHGVTLHR